MDEDPSVTVRKMAVHVPVSEELVDETWRDHIRDLMAQAAEAAARNPEAFMEGVLAAANEEMGL